MTIVVNFFCKTDNIRYLGQIIYFYKKPQLVNFIAIIILFILNVQGNLQRLLRNI